MQKPGLKRIAAVALCATLGACATTGAGVGSSAGGAIQAQFTWNSTDGVRGDMTAALSNGDSYQGPFLQVTHEVRIEDMSPLWFGWEGRGHWRGWQDWGPREGVATTYSGQVLANLATASGKRMRCRFTLARPMAGMAGGGMGRCQLDDGTVIHAQFAPS